MSLFKHDSTRLTIFQDIFLGKFLDIFPFHFFEGLIKAKLFNSLASIQEHTKFLKAYERLLLIYYFNGIFTIFYPLIVSKQVNLTVETSKLSFKFRIMRKLTFISVFLHFFR